MAPPRQPRDADHKIWRRVLWLHHEMAAGRHPNYEKLCRKFEISPRCATQTLKFMRDELGLRILFSRQHQGYTYEGEPPELPMLQPVGLISAGELAALQLAAAAARRFLDPETAAALSRLRENLMSLTLPEVRSGAAAWADEVRFTGPPPLPASHLVNLRRAIRARRVLEIDYRSPRHAAQVTREIEPHFLVNAAGDWLLVAWDRSREAPRTFALARIQGPPEWLDETFQPRPELDAGAFTQNQFRSEGGAPDYELALRFAPELAQLVLERKWHATQSERRLEDGSYEVHMRLGGVEDVLQWILSLGRGVEVLAPDWLRRRVADEAAAILRHYTPSKLTP